MNEKKYLIDSEKLRREWNWDKNRDLDPHAILQGSGKKVWWVCERGHEWQIDPYTRTRKHSDCPFCFGRKILVGFNDLKTLFPILSEEWDYEKNYPYIPENFTKGSGKKVWWRCSKCNHEWEAIIGNRAKLGRGCPICAIKSSAEALNKHRLKNGNSLAESKPELLNEWDYKKNTNISPHEVTPYSNRYAWWNGNCGHNWRAKINHRSNGSGCPFCSNQRLLVGFNDLASKLKECLEEWDYEKNDNLTPKDIIFTSQRKVWWICNKAHSYQMKVSDKYSGWKCPYCSHKKVLKGFNDLSTLNPRVSSEWDYEKNKDLTPNDVMPGTNKKVWWRCKRGHTYLASISNRNVGTGCPICNKENHSSMKEMTIYFYVKKYFDDAISSYRPDYLKGKEVDIYIPSLNLGIEYDGQFHHQNIERDLEKNKMLNGKMVFIRIREPNCPILTGGLSNDIILNDLSDKELEVAIKSILLKLTVKNPDVNIVRDLPDIYTQIEYKEKTNSFGNKHPELLEEWDHIKNGGLSPFTVEQNSSKKIWWKCKKGHTWQARVYTRNKGIGCPYCSGRYATDKNNLELIHPSICEEWNYDKNIKKPNEFTPVSGQEVWWKCKKCGHEWQARIAERVSGSGCPNCRKIRGLFKRKEQS